MTQNPNSGDDAPQNFIERYSILNERQFTSADVCEVVGINAKQLEHAIDPKRSILTLSTHEEARIKGKRRLFTGSDCLKINALFVANAIGFPQRYASTLAEDISRRAANRLSGLDTTPNLAIAAWRMKNGDWVRQPLHSAASDEPKLPLAFQLIAVDELIDQTLKKLDAVIADVEIPIFDVPDPVPELSLHSPENDFFQAWTKDEQGRNVRIGLTYEETALYESYANRSLEERDGPPSKARREEFKLHQALSEKHEEARLSRLAATFEDRRKAAESKDGK